MKNVFFLLHFLSIGISSFANGGTNIHDKLLQAFKETFPNAEKVVWSEGPGNYFVSFTEEGVLNSITYDKDGEFVTSMRYYQEKNLPYYILINIKRKYPGKKIFGVSEISSVDAILYYVKIEDDKRWMTVMSNNFRETWRSREVQESLIGTIFRINRVQFTFQFSITRIQWSLL